MQASFAHMCNVSEVPYICRTSTKKINILAYYVGFFCAYVYVSMVYDIQNI